MRTTIDLDEDVARALEALARAQGSSFESTVNGVLGRGLRAGEKPPPAPNPFVVKSASRGFRAGIDMLRLNRLSDEPDSEGFIERHHGRQHGS